jgi:hypothetical protein
LEKRWTDEVAPHLAAAAVEDLDGLALKVEEAQDADAAIRMKDGKLQSLQSELASLAGSAEKLSQALERAQECIVALGGVSARFARVRSVRARERANKSAASAQA